MICGLTPKLAAATLLPFLAQVDVAERLKGLKQGTGAGASGSLGQMIPVFLIVCLIGGVIIVSALAYQKFRERFRFSTAARRGGLTPREEARLRSLATFAKVEPPSRILLSTSCFEQVITAHLGKQMRETPDWRAESIQLRDLARKLGFVTIAAPTRIKSTLDVGTPWPIQVETPDSEAPFPGFVSHDSIDFFNVHLLDPERRLTSVRSEETLNVRILLDEEGGPLLPCRVERNSRRAPFQVFRFRHSAEILPEEAQAAGAADRAQEEVQPT